MSDRDKAGLRGPVNYSRLTDVLGRLLYENRLSEEELRGLREDKMESIRSFARFLKNSAA